MSVLGIRFRYYMSAHEGPPDVLEKFGFRQLRAVGRFPPRANFPKFPFCRNVPMLGYVA